MEQKDFDVFVFDCITSLNHLMQCSEVCKNDRAVVKINRFKKWVMSLQEPAEIAQAAEITENKEQTGY